MSDIDRYHAHNPELNKTTNGKMVYELFPVEYVHLNVELNTFFHPKLAVILAGYGPDDMDVKLAHIASYCEVGLDGEYNFDDRRKLCEILLKKLVEKREDPNRVLILQP